MALDSQGTNPGRVKNEPSLLLSEGKVGGIEAEPALTGKEKEFRRGCELVRDWGGDRDQCQLSYFPEVGVPGYEPGWVGIDHVVPDDSTVCETIQGTHANAANVANVPFLGLLQDKIDQT